jgi:hypothetical protein
MRAVRSTRHDSQTLVGWGLLVEAAIWVGFCLWSVAGLRSFGAPDSYVMGPFAWVLAALPVLVGAAVLLRPPRWAGQRVAVACFVFTLLANAALSVFAFYEGIGFDPSTAVASRVGFLVVGAVSVVLTAGVASSTWSLAGHTK